MPRHVAVRLYPAYMAQFPVEVVFALVMLAVATAVTWVFLYLVVGRLYFPALLLFTAATAGLILRQLLKTDSSSWPDG